MNEFLLYMVVTIGLMGRDNVNLSFVSAPFMIFCISGIVSYLVEKVIDAEAEIRTAYYNLNWIGAPVKFQKMIVIAMFQPTEIQIGGIFGFDYISLERFTAVAHGAYDFGLIILNLAKN